MDLKIAAFIFIFAYTAYCKPANSDDFPTEGDDDMQNDEYNNYGETDETVEESKMPTTPLKILTAPQEFVEDIGESVTLPCTIEGTNYVQVWKKKTPNEADVVLVQSGIKMGATPNMELLSNGSLKITNLHVQDSGIFKCTAMDTKQNSPTIEHMVNVRAPPQIESLSTSDNMTTLRSGQKLVLQCKASGYPKPTISWHKGSTRLDMQGETLTIEHVKHHHGGIYKCLADNKIGEPAFRALAIKIEHPPMISIEKLIVSTENSSNTELECIVHAEPRAQVVWKMNNRELTNGNRIKLSNNGDKHNLIIEDVRHSDFGIYTCEATNSIGSSQKNMSLVAVPAVHRFDKTQSEPKQLVLKFETQSKSNIVGQELFYKKKGTNQWKDVVSEAKAEINSLGNDVYEVKYVFSKALDPGDYDVKFRSKSSKGWSAEYVDKMNVDVFPKHGHHKSHKKGHKHGTEKHITTTPALPSQPDAPAEHQEDTHRSDFVKESVSKGTETGSSIVTVPSVAMLSIVLCNLLVARL